MGNFGWAEYGDWWADCPLFFLQYIILFVVKIFMGQVQEVNDVREYDLDDGKKVTASKKKEGEIQILNSWKEG